MGIETFASTGSPSSGTPDEPREAVPASFAVTTQLMEDAVPAGSVSVGSGLWNQEALFSNPFKDGMEEALVIDELDRLTYLRRTSSSDTGWKQDVVANVPGTFAEVVTAVHPNRSLWAFCVPKSDPSVTVHKVLPLLLTLDSRDADGQAICRWLPQPDALGSWNWMTAGSLCVSYMPDAGPMVMGGMSPHGKPGPLFLALTARIPAPEATDQSLWNLVGGTPWGAGGRIVGGGYVPSPGSAFVGTYMYYVFDGENLRRESFKVEQNGPMDVVEISDSVQQFCGTWNVPNLEQQAPQGDVGWIYLDKNGDLVTGHMAFGARQEVRTTVSGFTSATSWQDSSGMLHVYGLDHDNTLRVLHQHEWESRTTSQQQHPLTPRWTQVAVPGARTGIGGYDLASSSDRLTPFDYARDGAADNLLAYRPGAGNVWIVGHDLTGTFRPAYRSDSGIGGYNPNNARDQMCAYDYSGTGRADHLLAYRPGTGNVSVIEKKSDGTFSQVFSSTTGIGDCDLSHAQDRLFPYDFGSGKADYLVAYRAGTGTVWIFRHKPDGGFERVYHSDEGIGGYKPDDARDQMCAYDYSGTGRADHLLAYRPGTGKVSVIEKKSDGTFSQVFSSTTGIGGYDLIRPEDRLFPYDFGSGTGNSDHLVAYRPGTGTVWILRRKDGGGFGPVYDSAVGIGGYNPNDARDQMCAYDYSGTGRADHLLAYRPGTGKVSVIEKKSDGSFAPVYQAPAGASTPVTIGLHTRVADFQLDPYPDDKPNEIIKMENRLPSEAYCICTQDLTSSRWATDRIRLPDAGAPHVVSHYVADVTLLDQNGQPLGGRPISVTAESIVEVQVDTRSYRVGPGITADLPTNPSGKVTLSIAARGLNPPIIHVNADGLAAGAAIDFAGAVNSYLAGTGTLPSQNGTFTADSVRYAKVTDSQGKQTDLVPDWNKAKLTPDQIVTSCSTVYSMAASNSTAKLPKMQMDGYDTPQEFVGFVIQTWNPDRPSFQAFRTAEDLQDYVQGTQTHPAYGGWLDTLVGWAEDAWEGVKTGATKIAEIVVNVAEKVVDLAIYVGEQIVRIGTLVIDSLSAAAQAIETVFQVIAEAVERAIQWLKSLFSLKDIWETKCAMETGIKEVIFPYLESTFAHYSIIGEKWFEKQLDTVNTYFDDLLKRYGGDSRMGDFANKTANIADPSGQSIDKKDLNNPQASWLLNKTMGASPTTLASFQFTPPQSDLLTDFEQFLAKFFASPDLAALTGAVHELEALYEKFFTLGSTDGQKSSALATLINTLRKIVVIALKAADGLFGLVMDLLKKTSAGLADLLDTPLPDFGYINTLYKWVQTSAGVEDPEDMTVGGLCFLGLGFFATAIYKLVNGVDNPPFPGGKFPYIPPPPWYEGAVANEPTDVLVVNEQLVNFQISAIAQGVCSFVTTGATDLLSPFAEDFKFLKKVDLVFNIFGAAVNTWGLALGAPPISSGGEWDGWGSAAFAFSGAGLLVDWVGSIFGGQLKILGKRGTLLKNLGLATPVKDKPDEYVHSILHGSVLEFLLSGANLISGCISAKTARDLPDVLHRMVWAEVVLAPTPKLIQVARAAVDKAKPDNADLRTKVWAAASVLDALLALTSGILQGSAAADAKVHRPQEPATKSYTYKKGVDFTIEVEFKGGDGEMNKPLKEWRITNDPPPTDITIQGNTLHGNVANAGPRTVNVEVHDSFAPPQYARTTITINITD